MGWAVGNIGLMQTLLIIFIGHLVTIPTSLAIAEIATNQKVEGGGAYYIISRSFGLNIGGAIGITLYLSQAISVAFYVIAFAEAAEPVFQYIETHFQFPIRSYGGLRVVSVPTMALLALVVLVRGADVGMKLLYIVAVILAVSLVMFFMGEGDYAPADNQVFFFDSIENGESFFYVFTICFPAFTGIIAGLGLSGDLKEPRKSIPLGTIAATITGMIIYVLVAFKLAATVDPETMASDPLVMSRVAVWGPIIPIGLAAAAMSSALGSILVAPRTLQALGADKVLPTDSLSSWVATERPKDKEPINSSFITIGIAFIFVFIGELDFVAEILSMFFMVTYGAICSISFLEHFAGNPSYRPSFTSKWYFSLMGAILCVWLMFQMNAPYAVASIMIMVAIYVWLSNYSNTPSGMSRIFKGVIFQISRQLRVLLQKSALEHEEDDQWVPSVICISRHSFSRVAAFDMVRFISHKYGFGTYIHLIPDYFSKENVKRSRTILKRLLERTKVSKSNVYIDSLISPSYTSAIAQVLQLPGISGQDNNMILFEFSQHNDDAVRDITENYSLLKAADFDICVLESSEKGFGYRHELHVWLTAKDYENGNLMILLAYIILGHPEWDGGEIKIFAVYPEEKAQEEQENLLMLIKAGRLDISSKNVEVIAKKPEMSTKSIIREKSADADLTVIGFTDADLEGASENIFDGYNGMGNILFVNTSGHKKIIN